MDSQSEARLQNVYPRLADKVRQMADMLASEGIYIRVVQGLRTWQEQQALYAQGRTQPGKIVTNAAGGYSHHNFGLAADCCPSEFAPDQPFNPDWNSSHPNWKRMEAVAVSLGMTSGANWKRIIDAPHFQITGGFPESAPTDEMRKIFRDHGIEAVWAEVEKSYQ